MSNSGRSFKRRSQRRDKKVLCLRCEISRLTGSPQKRATHFDSTGITCKVCGYKIWSNNKKEE